MMSEMVERVARAICEAHGRTWDKLMPHGQDWWRAEAKAAIEALREPTRDMIVAAMVTPYPTIKEAGGIIEQGEAATKLEWQAMIDAALSHCP